MLDLQRDILPFLRRDAVSEKAVPPPPAASVLHEHYAQSIKTRDELREVFGDKYPSYLDINRPGERAAQKEYRKKVYRNPMRSLRSRIVGALSYIRQADDFEVKFPTEAMPEMASPGSLKLQDYCGEHFSENGSVVDWFFSEVVPAYVDDPNAVLLVLPEWGTQRDTQYNQPKLHLFPSEYVWVHRKGKFAVLCSPHRSRVVMPDGTVKNDGLIVYFLDHDSYCIARQTARVPDQRFEKKGVMPVYEWEILGLSTITDPANPLLAMQVFTPAKHYCSQMPAMKVGKKRVSKNADKEELFESLIADALPFVKEAQQNQSDIQVETNFHVSSKEWRRAYKCDYNGCKGGKVVMPTGDAANPTKIENCPRCEGRGYTDSGSGLEILYIHDEATPAGMMPGVAAGKAPAGAPGGFIPRPIEPLEKLIAVRDGNIKEAYDTINMQFVRETPQEVSGASKRYDREEMYRELNNQGVHLVGYLLRRCFVYIDAQLFGISGKQGKQVPAVLVPVRYNLENAELVRLELNDAKLNKYDPTLIEVLERKMLEYTEGEQSDQYKRYHLRTQIDPYRDMIDETKMYYLGVMYSFFELSEPQKALMQRMFMSLNFDGLVSDALIDNPDFWGWDISQQRDYIKEKSDAMFGTLSEKGVAQDMMNPSKPMAIKAPADLQNFKQTSESYTSISSRK